MTTLLVIDIGNTNVSLGLFDYDEDGRGELSQHWRIGTHRELLALGGRYRELYDKQYNFERDRFINPGEELLEEVAERYHTTPRTIVHHPDAGVGDLRPRQETGSGAQSALERQ